ncbi:MAG: OmpH family outer membrane protein [bacterium]
MIVSVARAADRPLKIGYVISDKILMESKAGKDFLERKKGLELQKKEELKQVMSELKELKGELSQKGMFLNEEARSKLTDEINAKERMVKRLEEDVYADLRKFVKKEMKKMNDEASAIVMKYGNENGYTVIYDVSSRGSNIVFIYEALDVTGEILERYNRKYSEEHASLDDTPADFQK